MPRIDYPHAIHESAADLTQLERAHRGHRTHSRLRLLCLLKAGQATSIQQATTLLGYSHRQLQRWWADYRDGGLATLLEIGTAPGRVSRLTPEAWEGLEATMTAGEIATLDDARRYLAEQWGIIYSRNGIWYQLHKHRSRKKSGRRQHQQADPQEQEDYKSDAA